MEVPCSCWRYIPHPFWSSISPLHGDSPSGPAGIVHPSWSKPPSPTPLHTRFEVLAAVALPKSSSPPLSHCILLRCNVGRKARKTAKFSCWLSGCSCCCWKLKSLGHCNPPPEKSHFRQKQAFCWFVCFCFSKENTHKKARWGAQLTHTPASPQNWGDPGAFAKPEPFCPSPTFKTHLGPL